MNPIVLASLLAALLLGAPGAQAHSDLERSSPRVGSVVDASPPEIRLWFTQSLESRFSRAELRSIAGDVIATGGVDPQNSRQIAIPIGPLPAGKYKVIWNVLSVDSHRTDGSFGFEIKP